MNENILILLIDELVQHETSLPDHCSVLLRVTVPDWAMVVFGDTTIACEVLHHRGIENLVLPKVDLVEDVQDGSSTSVVLQMSVVVMAQRVRPKQYWNLADLLIEEMVQEVSVGFEDCSVDEPNSIGVHPEARAQLTERAVVLVRILKVDPPRISLTDDVTSP